VRKQVGHWQWELQQRVPAGGEGLLRAREEAVLGAQRELAQGLASRAGVRAVVRLQRDGPWPAQGLPEFCPLHLLPASWDLPWHSPLSPLLLSDLPRSLQCPPCP